MFKKKNILVSGSSGFVGKFLFNSELSEMHNLQPIFRNGEFIEPLPDQNFQVTIHLAGLAHQNSAKPEDYTLANVSYTEKILELSRDKGVSHFIFLSSVKVMGEGGKDAYNELSVPSPMDDYGRTKLQAEELVKSFCHENKIDYTILRPPLLYGEKPKANILSLVNWIRKNRPVPISSRANVRSILSLKNLQDILMHITRNSASLNQTFLLQDPKPVSTEELAIWIANGLSRKPLFLRIPDRLGSMCFSLIGMSHKWQRLSGDLYVDDSYTRKVLNWTPKFSSEEAIRQMVHDMFKN